MDTETSSLHSHAVQLETPNRKSGSAANVKDGSKRQEYVKPVRVWARSSRVTRGIRDAEQNRGNGCGGGYARHGNLCVARSAEERKHHGTHLISRWFAGGSVVAGIHCWVEQRGGQLGLNNKWAPEENRKVRRCN